MNVRHFFYRISEFWVKKFAIGFQLEKKPTNQAIVGFCRRLPNLPVPIKVWRMSIQFHPFLSIYVACTNKIAKVAWNYVCPRVILNAVKNTNSRKSKNYPSEFFTPHTRMNFTNFHPFLTVIGRALDKNLKKWKKLKICWNRATLYKH